METRFLTQPKTEFSKTVRKHLCDYEVALIAMAYVSGNGIKIIEKELLQKRIVKIVTGIHGCISDLPALNNLVSRGNSVIDSRIFLGTNIFHPKLYIFHSNDSAALLVGSSNLTGSGLHDNEEAIIEIVGNPSSRPIIDAISYFDHLWNRNSISVAKYLNEYPNYTVKQNQNEVLPSDQKRNMDLARKKLLSENLITFKKKVNKTLFNEGKQTVPTEFNNLINLCNLHESVPFEIILPNGEKARGQMYYGDNNTGYYYQFKLSGSENVAKLKKQISIGTMLRHDINLVEKTVNISSV